MPKFHVNPKTGNTGICRATKDSCPFGSESEHFDNRIDAQKAYETKQEGFEQFVYKSNLQPQKGAHTLAIYDPMSEEIGVKELWSNKIFKAFAQKMDDSDEDTRLVLESGQVWHKSPLYGNQSWKFVAGKIDWSDGLEKGKSYDRSWLGKSIMAKGARLEKGGAIPHMELERPLDTDQKAGIVSSDIPWAELNWKVVTIEQMASSSNGERFFAITTEEEFLIAANKASLDVNSSESIREEFDEDPDDFIIQSMVRNKNGSYTAHQSSGSGRGDKYTVEYPAGTSFVIDSGWDSMNSD